MLVLWCGCMGVAEDVAPPVDVGAAHDGGGLAVDAGEQGDAGVSSTPDAGLILVDAGLIVDAGSVDAGDAFDAGSTRVPAFVLVGKQGRRAVSCDDGLTWQNDVSLDDALPENLRFRCFSGDFALPDGGSNNTDCDHNAWSSTSLAVAGEVLLHTMGWGSPGTIWRSTDAVSWSLVHTGPGAQDVLVGPSRVMLASRAGAISSDRGLTWTRSTEIRLTSGTEEIWNVRGGGSGGGSFVVSAQDGQRVDYQVSRDEGATWQRPQLVGGGRIDACGSSHPVYGNGVFVTATWTSAQNRTTFCRSADQGLTWTVVPGPPDYLESRVLFTGSTFIVWSRGRVHRSPDGLTWTSTSTSTRSPTGTMSAGPEIGAVALSSSGTFAAVLGGWNVWYDRQRFYRSSDGVTWDELPASVHRRSHPVTMMVFTTLPRGGVCP